MSNPDVPGLDFAEVDRIKTLGRPLGPWPKAFPRDKLPAISNEAQVARLELMGRIVRDCGSCLEHYRAYAEGRTPFAPGHQASSGCMSGKRSHCTCDTCF